MESMAYNTNAYTALNTSKQPQGRGRKLEEVFTPELGILLGIAIQSLNIWTRLDLKR